MFIKPFRDFLHFTSFFVLAQGRPPTNFAGGRPLFLWFLDKGRAKFLVLPCLVPFWSGKGGLVLLAYFHTV